MHPGSHADLLLLDNLRDDVQYITAWIAAGWSAFLIS